MGTFGYTSWQGGVGNYCDSFISAWNSRHLFQPLRLYGTKSSFDALRTKLPLRARVFNNCVFNPHDVCTREADFDVYFQLDRLEPIPPPRKSFYNLADVQERFFPEFFDTATLAKRATNHAAGKRYALGVITGSQFSAKSFVELLGFERSKIHVVPLPISDLPRRAVRPAGLPKEIREFVFFPAADYPSKNHAKLIAAMQLVSERDGKKLSLVCTGVRLHGLAFEEQAAACGVSDRSFHLGRVSRENIRWLYQNARMLVFPTLFEGFGIPIVEALNCGTPVVCSGTTCLPEIGGDAAVYCNPFDIESIASGIDRVWRDEKLAEMLVCKGRSRAQEFSVRKSIDAHEQVFRQAIYLQPRDLPSGPVPDVMPIDTQVSWTFYTESALPEIREAIPPRNIAISRPTYA